MSKSLNQILLPALGGTALLLGLAYGFASRNYASSEIEFLEQRVAQLTSEKDAAREQAALSAKRVADVEVEMAKAQAEASNLIENLTSPVAARSNTIGVGRLAHPEEIAAWDVDVLPDGRGLPVGSGNAFDGESIYSERCGACHGDFAEGVDNWPVLAGGFDTLADEDPVKTVGSYWPYLSTLFDYIHRSMPFGEAGTLTPDETYDIVAYILYSNDLIDDEFEINNENLGSFEMHNKDGFVIDDRPELEYAKWRQEPCMENCKPEVKVTMRSVFLVETPPEGGTNSVMNHGSLENLPSFSANGPSFIPVVAIEPVGQAVEEVTAEVTTSPTDEKAEMLQAGEKAFKKCKACHAVGSGAKNKSGPQLNALMGRVMGSLNDYAYSNVFKAAASEGRIWDEESLDAFLANPKGYMKGTKMSFSGIKSEKDREAIIAYLQSFGEQ